MLKDLPVFVSYCDSHDIISFFQFKLVLNFSFYTVRFITIIGVAVAKAVFASPDFYGTACNQRLGNLFSCAVVNALHGSPAHPQLCCALFLRKPFVID